jgi:hypothetical protein
LLIGNGKRGKPTAHLAKTSKHYYTYRFDRKGTMLSAENPWGSMEFFLWEGDTEYGFSFYPVHNRLSELSIAGYENGFIRSYTYAGCGAFTPRENTHMHHEEYFYQGPQLAKADVYFNISLTYNMYDKTSCTFRYNQDGVIRDFDTARMFQGTPQRCTNAVPKAKQIFRPTTKRGIL